MKDLKLDKNRKRVRYCPCGKSNRDGKFIPFIEYDKYGYCFSCNNTMRPDQGTIIQPQQYKKLPIFYHDPKLVSLSGRNFKNNNLITFLLTKFTKVQVEDIILKYCIGTSHHWPGATIFWQLDKEERIRHGKIMLYHARTGKRSNRFTTVKTVLKIDDSGLRLGQCLFGLHLINETNTGALGIVESEKTAIIMSVLYPEYVWLASGGKGGFSYNKLRPIRKYKIVAFPDKDGIEEWKDKANKFNKYGFNIMVNDMFNNMDIDKNADLADLFLAEVPKPQEILSKEDIAFQQLYEINPILETLLIEFDLLHENGKSVIY